MEQRLCLRGKLVAVKFFRSRAEEDKALAGLDFLFKAGLPYPIPPFGAQADPTPGWPLTYRKFMEEG